MSVHEKMTAIADAIREKTGQSDPLTLDGMAAAIPAVYVAGENAKQQEIGKKIYIGSVTGSGDVTLEVPLPFDPHCVWIFCYADTVFQASVKTILSYSADRASVGTVASDIAYAQSGSVTHGASTTTTTLQRCTYADGVLSVTPQAAAGHIWGSDSVYTVVAIREDAE